MVAAHRCANPRIFGSVAHGTDREGSVLDILADVMTPNALPAAFRDKVMTEAVPV